IALPITGPTDLPYTVNWEPPTYLSCTDCFVPIATPDDSIAYQIEIVDTNGCTQLLSTFVDVIPTQNVFMPNVFTPNGDNINDRFKAELENPDIQVVRLNIFDRWGGLMYSERNVPAINMIGWDGTYNGELMPPGVYVYEMEVLLPDGKERKSAGDITLIR
ncbi:MAG: gliding motility-associated C-terminal domain-containing protein, partial [Bacteroidota bacterium]